MLVLDAYNILHVTGVLPAEIAGIDVSGLIELVRVSRYGRDEIVVVCDGVRRDDAARSEGSVRVVFSGSDHEADDLIEGLLAKTPRSKRAIVVSTDARLRKAAGRHHARVLRSEVFLHQLAIDHAAHGRGVGPIERRHLRPEFAVDLPLDSASVARWAAEMGVGDVPAESRPAGRGEASARAIPRPAPPAKVARPGPRLGDAGRGSARGAAPDSSDGGQIADLSMEQWLQKRPMLAEDKPGETAGGERSHAGRSGRRRSRRL